MSPGEQANSARPRQTGVFGNIYKHGEPVVPMAGLRPYCVARFSTAELRSSPAMVR